MNGEHAARTALERMNHRSVAIAPHYSGLAADLRLMAEAEPEKEQREFLNRRTDLCSAYGFSTTEQRKPFAFADGFAIIPVCGSLINRFGSSWSYVTGYTFIRSQLALALGDDDVKAIIFDLNSYGGEAAGCFELSDDIFSARGKKPMLGVIDSNCYSACYAIGSALDRLVCTPSGGAGSIGVVAMHVDMSEYLSQVGVKVTFIHGGEHKVDGNPYEPLSDEVRADIQKEIDVSYDKFVSLVARNREIDASVVRDTQARCFRAEDALSLGLIDAIVSPSAAVKAFTDELLSGSNFQLSKEDTMSDAANKPDGAATEQVAATARTAERARVAGIMNCEQAAGRSKLANHLALETDLSIESAQAILAAAPAEVAPAAAAPAAAANPFKAAMDSSNHPQVGADGMKGEQGGAEMSAAEMILRAQSAATGVPFKS